MFFKKKYTDIEIIQGLKLENNKSRAFENYLYEFYKNWIRHGQKRYHLSESDSLNAYIDAYSDLVRIIRKGEFSAKKAIAPFFKTIFDRKCVDHLRKLTNEKNRQTDSLDNFLDLCSEAKTALEELITTDYITKILPLLDQLGKNCRAIIRLWSQGYAHKEIASQLATVGSDKSSKAILNKCLQKIRAAVHTSNP